jgi:P4 family phage/plasmid primase-like protien
MQKITFKGFKALDNSEELQLTIDELSSKNNYFENTDISKSQKLRIWIDIDGKISDIDINKFNIYDNLIIEKLKSIEYISVVSSSHFESEKWSFNKEKKIYEMDESIPKFSYRITYINEYCDNLDDLKNIVIHEKQEELKNIFSGTDISIGVDKGNILNIDLSVYRRGMSKMRCVNAYKYKQQDTRINKLLKGEIIDTLITYIPENAKLKKYISTNDKVNNKDIKKEKIKTIDKEIVINDNNRDLKELLDSLSSKRYDELYYWIRVYWVFINEKLNLDLFEYFSKKSKFYDKEKNDKILNKFKKCDGYKISTLYFWLKEDNYNIFVKLQKTRKDFWNIIQEMNHSDLSKLYFSITPTKYVVSSKTGWYEYNHNNILVNTNKVPSSLLNNLSDELQGYVIEQRNLLLPTDENYNIKNSFIKKAYISLGNSRNIKCVIDYLTNLYLVDNLDDLLDSKISLLAFNNCLYDMNIKSFRNINTDDYITKTTKYEINKKSNPQIRIKINNLIKSIFEDENLEEYWKIITGLSLFTTKMQSLFIHVGTGGNGKGVLATILRNCLGEYFLTAENTFLTTSFKAGSPNPTLANSKGTRYLFISEPDDGKDSKFNIDFIKTMTGGDPICTRDLYKSNIEFIPQFSANVQCNNKPELGKIDKGIVRRIKIIPYPFNFVDNPSKLNERKRDYELNEQIIKDEFKNEFMLMLIEKATEFYNKDISKDIKIPEKVLEKTTDYIDDNNPIKNWIESRLIITSNNPCDKIELKLLLNLYNENAEKQLDIKEFKKYMEYNSIEYFRSNGKSYFKNIILNKENDNEE